VGDRSAESRERFVVPFCRDAESLSVAVRKAIAAARYDRFVRVSDFYAPISAIAYSQVGLDNPLASARH
jgi:hypothetical protein